MHFLTRLAVAVAIFVPTSLFGADIPTLFRTAQSGTWSNAATWEGNQTPSAGSKVQIRAGHEVVFDVPKSPEIRSLHIAGTLSFVTDKDTQLDVGLIRIQAGDNTDEDGFDCSEHFESAGDEPQAALLVGTPNRPIAAHHKAVIRLVYVKGLDEKSCPAIVCCGGRMDFHGSPLHRTWLKLGAAAKEGDTMVTLEDAVTDWRIGDRVILTATTRQNK